MAVFLIVAAVLTIRSYSYSDTLTFMDVTLTADEGLLSINVPLVPLAPDKDTAIGWITYKRDSINWKAGLGGKSTLRNWMATLDSIGCEGTMFLDFGYWLGGWQSDSRPGAFIVLFAPVWFSILIFGFGVVSLSLGWIKINLKMMFAGTALVAGLIWLLTLRAAA